MILPLDAVLRHYPLVHSPLTAPARLHELQTTWTQRSIRALSWTNLLLTVQHRLRAAGVEGRLPGDLSLSAEALAAPKSVKVLFWSAATADLASLQVTEKGKVASLVPVRFVGSRTRKNADTFSIVDFHIFCCCRFCCGMA